MIRQPITILILVILNGWMHGQSSQFFSNASGDQLLIEDNRITLFYHREDAFNTIAVGSGILKKDADKGGYSIEIDNGYLGTTSSLSYDTLAKDQTPSILILWENGDPIQFASARINSLSCPSEEYQLRFDSNGELQIDTSLMLILAEKYIQLHVETLGFETQKIAYLGSNSRIILNASRSKDCAFSHIKFGTKFKVVFGDSSISITNRNMELRMSRSTGTYPHDILCDY